MTTDFGWPEDDPRHALLEAAHDYRLLGWALFACGPDKMPLRNCGERECRGHTSPELMRDCGCLVCHGPYAASGNEEKIACQLEAAGPDASLALATGARSGVFVVDLDPTAERSIEKLRSIVQPLMRGGVGDVLMARTPRGGIHLYFATPKERIPCSVGRIAPGIDVRGEGGYVILPPSKDRRWNVGMGIDDGEHFMTASLALIKACTAPRKPPMTPEEACRTPARTPRASLSSLCAFVSRAPEGERNSSLHWAACRAGEEVAKGSYDALTAEMELVNAATTAGLARHEAQRTVERAIRMWGTQ